MRLRRTRRWLARNDWDLGDLAGWITAGLIALAARRAWRA